MEDAKPTTVLNANIFEPKSARLKVISPADLWREFELAQHALIETKRQSYTIADLLAGRDLPFIQSAQSRYDSVRFELMNRLEELDQHKREKASEAAD